MSATFQGAAALKFLKTIQKKSKDVETGQKKYAVLVGARVFADLIDHFEQERGPKRKWEPWSFLYTLAQERAGKGGNKILQDNGRLRNAFKPTNFFRSKKGMVFFNDAKTKSGFPYAKAHDEGGEILDQRQFMWLSKKAQKKILGDTLRFILRGL